MCQAATRAEAYALRKLRHGACSKGGVQRWAIPFLLSFLLPSTVLAQVFVIPRRAQKSQVRHFNYDWKHIDIAYDSLATPEATPAGEEEKKDEEGPGIRLYFYE